MKHTLNEPHFAMILISISKFQIKQASNLRNTAGFILFCNMKCFLWFVFSLHEKPPFLNLLQLLWKPCVAVHPWAYGQSPAQTGECSAGPEPVEVCSYCCTLEGTVREQAGTRKMIHLIDPTSVNLSSQPPTDTFGGGCSLAQG